MYEYIALGDDVAFYKEKNPNWISSFHILLPNNNLYNLSVDVQKISFAIF